MTTKQGYVKLIRSGNYIDYNYILYNIIVVFILYYTIISALYIYVYISI